MEKMLIDIATVTIATVLIGLSFYLGRWDGARKMRRADRRKARSQALTQASKYGINYEETDEV